jgi:formate hydrogenlyase transcriptional activator
MSFPLLTTEGKHGQREALRYQVLRKIADAMVVHREPRDLFRHLARRLKKALSFNFINFVLHDPATDAMHLHGWETTAGTKVLHTIRWTVDDTAAGWVWQRQRSLLIPDVQAESRFPKALATLREHHVRTYYVLPMSTGTCKLGTIGIGSGEPAAYGAHDLYFLQAVAHFVAVAVEKALKTKQVERERDRLRLLLGLSNTLVSNHSLEELFPAIASTLRTVIQHDITTLMLYDAKRTSLRMLGVDHPEAIPFAAPEATEFPLGMTLAAEVLAQAKPLVFHHQELAIRRNDELLAHALAQGIRSICCVPLTTSRGQLGAINLLSRRERSFETSDLDLLLEIGTQVGIALENTTAFAEIAQLKERLAQEKLYLENEIRTEHNFEHIVGRSRALKKVLAQVETVAPSEATVLVLGETGTGKELIARATHNLSVRRSRSFVKLNCAAIPTGLLESELFGHEKGAFTGAVAQKLGRFELADQGTLFLDEVGEIPLDAQPKLLRALQDQEFERLGGTRTIRVNVRVVAATNRDLAQMVAEHQFRSDLYYRLNVFPIQVPPLRYRRSDIPMLVRYFVHKFSERRGMQIETIPADTMEALSSWPWPGNVRELANVVERAVILSKGSVLRVPLAELQSTAQSISAASQTLEGAERDHICHVLSETRGLVAGPSGAAARLGLKRTTLLYKMEKLGISSQKFRSQRYPS